MLPAKRAFLDSIVVAKGDNEHLIKSIQDGRRIIIDGHDRTEERLADAKRRLADATAILLANGF
jgi:hypothetical protein